MLKQIYGILIFFLAGFILAQQDAFESYRDPAALIDAEETSPFAQPPAKEYNLLERPFKQVLMKYLKWNESQVDRVFLKASRRHITPWTLDIRDDNYNVTMRTGTYDPAEPPVDKNTVWIISIFGNSIPSDKFMDFMESVASEESHVAGGRLPKRFRFARIDYAMETVIPTKWLLFNAPKLIIANYDFTQLRFLKPSHLRLSKDLLVEFLLDGEWKQVSVWDTNFSPQNRDLLFLGKIWKTYERWSGRIPAFLMVMISSAVAKFLIDGMRNLFGGAETEAERKGKEEQSRRATRAQQREALRNRMAKEGVASIRVVGDKSKKE